MKFSLEWLGDFVDTAAAGGAEGIRAHLEQAGIPLESMERSGTDVIFDFEITPNRPDAMSHRGIAREIAAIAGLPLKSAAEAPLPPSGPKVEELASVEIEVSRLCRRFGARVVSGIGNGPAPQRVRSRLTAIGAKPISAAVDATNYVLWEMGQPLHAFDLDKLAGRRVIVRKARTGERLVLLDGVEYALTSSDVVVADAEKAVSLAGIMGGLETSVTPATKNVLLEAAWWDPAAIRRTSRRLGLHTDASHRFERGADPEAIPDALDRAARLLVDAAGGTLAPGRIDARGIAFKPKRAYLRLSRLRLLAGDDRLELAFAEDALTRLGFGVSRRGKRIAVAIPSWRPDVSIEDDLVEEVLRVYGYSRLPSTLPAARGGGGHLEPLREVEERLADSAAAAGLLETMSSPFVDHRSEERPFSEWLTAADAGPGVLSLANPLDEERKNLRTTLMPGLLDAAARNVHRGERSVGLFEVGRVFDRAGDPDDPPSFESRRFAFALAGEWRQHWSASGSAGRADFFDAKGLAERLLDPFLEAASLVWKPISSGAFAAGAAAVAQTAEGRPAAIVGLLSRSEREKRKVTEPLFVGEIRVDALPAQARPVRFAPYSSYPPIEADLSFAHARERTWAEIRAFIENRRLRDLDSVRILDRYEGAGVPAGHVKTTVRLTFRSLERTLEQEEVNREVARLGRDLEAGLGAVFG
ncbi:MAG TPA: phenylalanine--tRNA ligase subunit beta [Thermoanaerobaculia bacterium]